MFVASANSPIMGLMISTRSSPESQSTQIAVYAQKIIRNVALTRTHSSSFPLYHHNPRTSIISSTIIRCSARIILSHHHFLVYIVVDLLVREHTISPDGSVDPGVLGDRSRLNLFPIIEEREMFLGFKGAPNLSIFYNFKISSAPQYYASWKKLRNIFICADISHN